MSHDVESMMLVRDPAWHGLGNILSGYPKTREALLEAAGLDWQIAQFPVTVTLPSGKVLMADDKMANVRMSDESLLSIMGSGYTPIQPYELLDFSLAVLDEDIDALEYETAMSLAGGRVNVLLCRVPREIKIGGADDVELYLCFVNSHDGSYKFGVHATPVRVVCRNTLNASFRTAVQSWSTRHSADAKTRIDEARKTLQLTWKYADEFERSMNALLDREFTKANFEDMVRVVFPKPANEPAPFSKEQYSLIGLLESSPTIDDGIRYTRYGAYNAVLEYQDWGRRFNEGGAPIEEKRVLHTMFGDAKKIADKTFQYLAT